VGGIDVSAWVAPTAVVTGDVSLGPGARVLHGAVLNGDRGPVVLGEDVVIMENAVLRAGPSTHSSLETRSSSARMPT
jgi:carbonic anhydrase/acetyltransferase-like protein (isoleucine patch superfamily)